MRHWQKPLARALRRGQTEAEALLWERLRDRGLQNLKFRRQCPVERYIADFYCHESRLIVELDGGMHDLPRQSEHDRNRNRDTALAELGYEVLRFRNEEVLVGIEGVLERIADRALTPLPPLPGGEGE